MGCGGSKEGPAFLQIVEEELPPQPTSDVKVNFYTTIMDPVIHLTASQAMGAKRCKLVVNQRMGQLTRVIGNDVVTIDLGVLAALNRHLDDPNKVTLVTGGAKETWALRFNDDALAHNFYQCALMAQPFNVETSQCIAVHFFHAHFRGAAVPDYDALVDVVPQNPDGYFFSIVGGTVEQRDDWFECLKQVSAVAEHGEDWLCQYEDDQSEGGFRVILWLATKHEAYIGNVCSQIVSAYPLPKEGKRQGRQIAEIVAQVNEVPAEGEEAAAEAEAEAEAAPAEVSEAEVEAEIASQKRLAAVKSSATIGAISFSMGETTFGCIASSKGNPDLMDQIGLGNPSLGAFQFDHVTFAGDMDELYIGNDDLPQNVKFTAAIQGAFGWRSLAPHGLVCGSQVAKGTLETGKYAIFKLPFVLPAVAPPVSGTIETRKLIVFFRDMIATDLPFTRLGNTEEKPAPFVSFSGQFCRDTQIQPIHGCKGCPVHFSKQQRADTAKGEVFDEVIQGISVHTYVADAQYLAGQVLQITVRDESVGHFVYGSALFSMAELVGQIGTEIDFTCVLNSNGRFGGRLAGKVTLLRTGDPIPRETPSDGGVKRAPGELSAAEKLKARLASK